jgi:hypothetical protein
MKGKWMERIWKQRPVVLEDFQKGNPSLSTRELPPHQKLLWSQYPNDPTDGPDYGVAMVRTRGRLLPVLHVNVQAGNCYLQRNPHNPETGVTESLGARVRGYQADTYWRLRFWVRTAAQLWQPPAGSFNLHVGTYLRSKTERSKQETSILPVPGWRAFDGHAYHYYAMPNGFENEWHLIEVDSHPHHLRDSNLDLEEWDGQLAYPTGEAGYNYFDAMTRFYIDFLRPAENLPVSFEFRKFELLRGEPIANIRQVYGVHAVYSDRRQRIHVGWSCNRHENGDQGQVAHALWFSERDFNQGGWAKATCLAREVRAGGTRNYNAMAWEGSFSAPKRGHGYLAIQPANRAEFRQAEIWFNDF